MSSKIFTFEKLYKAYLDCRKTKRKTINALKFEYNLERNLLLLLKELQTRQYKFSRSICFVVTEPSAREIFAASFRDRIVHHLLVREVENMGEKGFIFDSFACRKGKGTHFAIKRLKTFIRRLTKNFRIRGFCLQLDISGFFMAIDHNILFSIFEKLILKQNKSYNWKSDILWLSKIIIFHKPTKDYIIKGNLCLFDILPPRKSLFNSKDGKGLPIGNYSSQFFANIYLNKLDQFIKRKLKCRNYVRYVDDLILLDNDKNKLKDFENKINYFLKTNLELELNLSKTKLRVISKGINFLGYFIKLDYVLVRQRVATRLKEKLLYFDVFCKNKCYNNINIRLILATINSYYGHFRHAFTYNLRKDIYKNHLRKLKQNFLPNKDYFSLKYVKK